MELNAKKRKNTMASSKGEPDPGELYVEKKKRKLNKIKTASGKQGSKDTSKIFPFLSLPPELRNKIYTYALSQGSPNQDGQHEEIQIADWTVNSRRVVFRDFYIIRLKGLPMTAELEKSFADKAFAPALLQVCKQICEEATPILYAHDFQFEDCGALHGFLAPLSQTTRDLLHNISIRNWHVEIAMRYARLRALQFASFSLLVFCKNIRSIQIPGSTGAVKRIYEDTLPFWEARAAKLGGIDAALEILDISITQRYYGQPVKENFFKAMKQCFNSRSKKPKK